MSIEQEAKDFIEDKKPLEPVALHCNDCGKWSGYNEANNYRMPRGWKDDEHGFHCGCLKHKKRK